MKRSGMWTSEWSLDLEAYATAQVGKRFKRRMARFEHGSDEYLVSVTDTSAAARRRFSPYDFSIPC